MDPPTPCMTEESLGLPDESSQMINNDSGIYMRSEEMVARASDNSIHINRDYLNLQITYSLYPQSMTPLRDLENWMETWRDFETTQLHRPRAEINKDVIPFYPGSLPEVVLEQYDTWLLVVKQIEEMISKSQEWSPEIDSVPAMHSLLEFKNLLLAPRGLRFKHLMSEQRTQFARLGPCATVRELRHAMVVTKVCAYYAYEPFDVLQALLNRYKKLLRKTDGRYLHHIFREIENEFVVLENRVKQAWADKIHLHEQITEILKLSKGKKESPVVDHLRGLYQNLKVEEDMAREKAHCHFQYGYYVHAQYEDAERKTTRTPMDDWIPPEHTTPPHDCPHEPDNEHLITSLPGEASRREHNIGELAIHIRQLAESGFRADPIRTLPDDEIDAGYETTRSISDSGTEVYQPEAHEDPATSEGYTVSQVSEATQPEAPVSQSSRRRTVDRSESGSRSDPVVPPRPRRRRSVRVVQQDRPDFGPRRERTLSDEEDSDTT